MSRTVLKQLACPNCGTALSQYTPNTQTLVCPNCGSYVAVGSGDPEVSGKTRKLPAPAVPVELGKTIKVEDVEYLVLGRVVYIGWDDEDRWQWDEWQVGAEDGRMLWLSYDEKGFSIYKKERFRGQFDTKSSRVLELKSGTYPIHERYPAKIVGAEGELTWRASEDERLYVAEGARGGQRYSVQQTGEELEVYTGVGVSELEIAKAFEDETWINRVNARITRGANMRMAGGLSILFAIAAIAMAIATSAIGERVEQTVVPIRESAEFVDVDFNQPGRPAVVNMSLRGGLPTNTYMDVNVSMIAPDEVRTESFLFTKSFWHETGYDDEGAWTDTSYRGNGMFVPLMTGTHQLKLEMDQASTFEGDMQAEITIRRNAWAAQWFVVYGVMIGIVGAALYFLAPSK